MVNHQQLIADHDRIDLLAAKLENVVESELDPESDVDALLASLAGTVARHLEVENSFIYPDLVNSNDPAGASALILEFEVLKRDWQEYLATWQAGLAVNNWTGFRKDTLGMLQRLRERVMKETSLLYSMALREGIITMLPVDP